MSKDDTAVTTVLKLIVEGQAESDIKEFLTAAGLSDAEGFKIIEDALIELEKTLDVSKDLRLAWCLEALRDLYRRLVGISDFTGAIRAVTEIAKLSAKLPDGGRMFKDDEIGEETDDTGEVLEKLQKNKILTIPRK